METPEQKYIRLKQERKEAIRRGDPDTAMELFKQLKDINLSDDLRKLANH